MKRASVLILSVIVLAFSSAAFAQKKGKAPATPVPNGMWDAVDVANDYTVAVYEFDGKKKTLRIMDGKDDYLLSFNIKGDTMTLYYMQNNKPTKNVFESWTYSAADKNFKVVGDYELILRDRNTAPKEDPKKKKKKKKKPNKFDKYKKMLK